ncbi:nucleotidyltransferase family protein [Kaistia dalseonensis]|uniref:CTP:molybdopterin cytidylyltransferase MocA n=1 Tax=Kaistia dalseonensis TaxID=410840 RepID=A0ABU0HBC0_9HYPH|nr:nucleotidyltransferase family protein [Kaistia dalseonensis]MCX5496983.1 nucleotidyltransferase family protein [Kaistia dalseonensis]MDQ0439609.1 CTP:molybdopterin cytidylyltransferase MocA [Kaistia dalseonensis]
MKPRIAILILAAGQGRRMGGPNKLLAEIDGRSLVRRAAEAALASAAASVTVVTGHRREAIELALAGLPVQLVHNEDHADGLATSLRAGIAHLGEGCDAVLVMLADMPAISAAILDRLMAAFAPEEGRLIVVPTHEGARGNPVILSRSFFPEIAALTGDKGARGLIAAHDDVVVEVEIGPEVMLDLDTPEGLAALGGRIVG